MLFDDTYYTIENPAEAQFSDRGSKFIAYAFPVTTEADVKAFLQQVKGKHPKANHHCWAMRLTPDRSVFRVNDDGEPSGTAGRPILNVVLSKNITNIFIVVVRYFGGTLLGVPGLINAYKTSADEVLKIATIIQKTVNDIYSIEFDYLQMNDVMRIIKEENLTVLNQQFDNQCSITFSVRQMQVNAVMGKLNTTEGLKAKFLFQD